MESATPTVSHDVILASEGDDTGRIEFVSMARGRRAGTERLAGTTTQFWRPFDVHGRRWRVVRNIRLHCSS